jgi:broad specificity phosphatase PhoE
VLAGRPVARVVTSPYLRCVQTVEPLASVRGVAPELREELGETAPPDLAVALLRELAAEETVVCVHGSLRDPLGLDRFQKGAALVVATADLVVQGYIPPGA